MKAVTKPMMTFPPAQPAVQTAPSQPDERRTILLGRILVVAVTGLWVSSLAIGFQDALLGLTLLSFVLVAAGLLWPGAGLMGLGMAVTLDPLTRGLLNASIALPFNSLNFILLAVMALFVPFLVRVADIHSRLLQALLVLMMIELAISPAITSGINHILNAVTVFGMLALFARAERSPAAQYWMGMVAGVTGALGGLFFITEVGMEVYVNPNAWAKLPVAAIMAACIAFPAAKEFKGGRFVLFLLSVINFVWVFLSGSRGNMAIGAVGLLFLFVWERKFSWRLAAVLLLVVGGLAATRLFADQESMALGRVIKLFDENYTLSERTSGRSGIAERGLELFRRNPMGVGTGGFLESVSDVSLFADSQRQAHSAWLKVLAENGVPGILLFTAWVGSFAWVGLRSLKRKRRIRPVNAPDEPAPARYTTRERVLMGILATFVLAVTFLSTEFQGKNLWFLAAGAAAFLHQDHYREILNRNSLLLKRARGKVRRVNEWRKNGG